MNIIVIAAGLTLNSWSLEMMSRSALHATVVRQGDLCLSAVLSAREVVVKLLKLLPPHHRAPGARLPVVQAVANDGQKD